MAKVTCSSPLMFCQSVHTYSIPKDSKLKLLYFIHSHRSVSKSSHAIATRQITSEDLHERDSEYQNDDDGLAANKSIAISPSSHQVDERYKGNLLTKIGTHLDSCSPNEEEISRVLRQLGETFLPYQCNIITRVMKNPEMITQVRRFFMQNSESRDWGYRISLSFFKMQADMNNCEAIFEEMLRIRIDPDVETYSDLITCACACRMYFKAVEWYGRMKSSGFDLNESACNSLIVAYGKLGNFKASLSLFEHAKMKNWKLSCLAYATVIRGHVLMGDTRSCLAVYDEMRASCSKLNLATYNMLLIDLSQLNKPHMLRSLHMDMINDGLFPAVRSAMYLLQVYCKYLYIDDALCLYRELKRRKKVVGLWALNGLLGMCSMTGQVRDAVEVFEDIKKNGFNPDFRTFNSLLLLYANMGTITRVEGLLKESLDASISPSRHHMKCLILCYANAGSSDGVVRAFDRMIESGVEPSDNITTTLIEAMVKLPMQECKKIIKCIGTVSSHIGYLVTLLVEERNEKKFKHEAHNFFIGFNPRLRQKLCNCLMDLCCKLGMLGTARWLLDLAVGLKIYHDFRHKTSSQMSINLRGFSWGGAMMALHAWMDDLLEAIDHGEKPPPLLVIAVHNRKFLKNRSLLDIFTRRLRKLGIPFDYVPHMPECLAADTKDVIDWLRRHKSGRAVSKSALF